MFFDYWYIVLVLPALFLGLYAQSQVTSTFRKYSSVFTRNGLTASEIARQILDKNGLYHVQVMRVAGNLTDHYDPRNQTVNLSDSVYNSSSVASIGVAAHEVGHAIQHATGYSPLKIRNAIIPVTNFGSSIAPFIILIGFLVFEPLIPIGILLFSTVAVFQLITLPVEFNASSRALKTLDQYDILDSNELSCAKKVLSAAAFTYVAALIATLANILRFILIYSDRRDRR